ncbi:hypothetical protein SEA_SENDITCS_31 [Streptomyces phage SendItCS]|nr:hypothetical protein SEA_SENDITCS_31 [Streptomyces phage SendItCS]
MLLSDPFKMVVVSERFARFTGVMMRPLRKDRAMPLYLVIINTIGPLILAFITIAEIRDTALDAEIQDEQMPSVID